MPAAVLNTLKHSCKAVQKINIFYWITVTPLQLEKLLYGCFPFFVSTLLWINLFSVSWDEYTPSLFHAWIRNAVPPWLSIRSTIRICIGIEQWSSTQNIIEHNKKEHLSLFCVVYWTLFVCHLSPSLLMQISLACSFKRITGVRIWRKLVY